LQFDSSKTMHVRGDRIHPCKGLHYTQHPATCVESEVYTAYLQWRWRHRVFDLLRL